MRSKIFIVLVLGVFLPAMALADLTGVWHCDDGGRYYLRQVGSTLYWYGEINTTKPQWANVYDGRIHGDMIRGSWADIPKGKTTGNGQLTLKIEHKGKILVATQKTGGFGGSRWVRAGYIPPPVSSPQEDCIGFNPNRTTVAQIRGRWKVVDGNHYLFDFGSSQKEARQTLRIIKYFKMNQSCFIGRPHPSFQYMLSSGQAPSGGFMGEDCIRFNPSNIQVKSVGGRWKIVDGGHFLFDFSNNEKEARQALAVMKKYGFSQSCFVGRPGPSFQYLKK
jgi:hypothetical protein